MGGRNHLLAGFVDSRSDGRKGQLRMAIGETIKEVIVSYAVRASARPENEQRSPVVPKKVIQAFLAIAAEQWKAKTRHGLAYVLCLQIPLSQSKPGVSRVRDHVT